MGFHLGRLGALRALPSPSLGGGPDATATRIGGVHRSLGGRVTVDRVAVKRAWSLTWPYLDPDSHAYLDALYLGLVDGPLWLLDGERRNRLSPQVAATGAGTRTTAGFTPTAGTLLWTPTVPSAPLRLAGGLDWTPPTVGGSLAGDRVPLVGGEPVTASAWVRAGVTTRVRLELYDTDDSPIGHVDSPPSTPGADQRLVVSLIATSAAAARMALLVEANPSSAHVLTTAWQLEPAPAPTAWVPGGGAAEVVLDGLSAAYPVPGSWATTLTLLEV
ncbi:hypothetical protein JOD54_001925 [Actinokineospora baliensis]|uniref:hypothetical protein n=1 Tax=Actinokineospora baliensis TaxID=547056 RepID=UPI00195BE149|nr:hypothetical protein [Actinokineospora baliensis]MBM7771721.1 hypothetical protein [Actinokineospora baliensis]